MKNASAFIAGLVFAIGLGIGGMTNPAKVLGFLDVAGAWDPSLAFVMLGAIGVGAVAFRRILARPRPVLESAWSLPATRGIDRNLLLGAALFGVGWGLAGFCPGPALVSLAFLKPEVYLFVAAMAGGFLAHRVWHERG